MYAVARILDAHFLLLFTSQLLETVSQDLVRQSSLLALRQKMLEQKALLTVIEISGIEIRGWDQILIKTELAIQIQDCMLHLRQPH